MSNTERRLIPVTKWNQYHDFPTESGLRYLIFHGDRNGFNKVIRKVGKRILIDEQSYFEWIDNNQSNG